ncbi:MAG: hypothetical protein ACK4PI_01085 [Tepidisphaerales bacterium]
MSWWTGEAERAWQAVLQRHPRLAGEISRELFVAEVGKALRESEAYRRAMGADDRVRAAEAAAEVVAGVLRRLLP